MRLTHLPRTAEKSLRALHRRCIEPTRKGPTTTTLDRIVGPSQTRDRVEDDHYITAQLDPTASSLQGQFRNREMLRSEEHTSELQSRGHLVCRLLLAEKNKR